MNLCDLSFVGGGASARGPQHTVVHQIATQEIARYGAIACGAHLGAETSNEGLVQV